jgi:RNA polymerase sigma-70 factor (ECF subfamily)
MERDEDAVVIEQILNGNTRSFEVLLKRHESAIHQQVARRVPPENAAEVTHDVFLRAYKSLSAYTGRRPLRNWLAGIATRTCHDFWRARYRNRETPISVLSDNTQDWLNRYHQDSRLATLPDMAERYEIRELLDWALSKLCAKDRMLMMLMYFEEHSVAETANLLDMSAANVKIRSFRARRKLRKILASLLPNDTDCNAQPKEKYRSTGKITGHRLS